MRYLLNKYVEGIQDLRVRAGLVRASMGELKQTFIKSFIASTISSSAVIVVLYNVGLLLPIYLVMIICLTIVTLITYPYVKYWRIVRTRRRTLEEEFYYFIISEAITCIYSTELIGDICDLARWRLVFKELSQEGLRLRVFRKFLTSFETINIYLRYSTSESVARLLSDYMLSLARGTVNQWLLTTSNELLHKLRNRAKALIQLRTTIVLVIGIVISYLPSLMISIAMVTGSVDLASIAAIMPIILFSLLMLPRLTLHLKTVNSNAYTKIKILKNTITYVLIYLILFYSLTSLNPTISRYVVLCLSTTLVVNGILNLINFIKVLTEVNELPRLISVLIETPHLLVNPLQGLKEVLKLSKLKSFRLLGHKLDLTKLSDGVSLFKSWLGRYVYYIIVKSIINGGLDRERLLNLRTLTIEMVEDLKYYLINLLPLIMMSLMMPWILLSIASLARVNVVNYILLIYLLITTYALYVDYVILDSIGNTLITGISLLTLTSMWL